MPPKPPIESAHASRYMARFRCIGPACEAHCCQGWQIFIDRDNFSKLKKTLGKNPSDRDKFSRRVKRRRNNLDSGNAFAQIQLDRQTGVCPFLEESGLCEVHRRFGEELLSGTCRTYPRKPAQVHNRLELSASLSCPEIARLCLLAPDGGEAEAVTPGSQPHAGLLMLGECLDSADPYCRYIDQIREIIRQLLRATQYPLIARIFFIGYLANRTTPFFHRNCQQSFSEEQLAAEVDRIATTEMLDQLLAGYRGLDTTIDLPLDIVSSLLQAKSSAGLSAKFFREILGRFADDAPLSEVLEDYTRRRDGISTLLPERINLYLQNYCENYLFSHLYSDAENLLEYLQGMCLRLSAICFLLFSHPRLDALLAESGTPLHQEERAAAEQLLDEVAVEAFFKFSRALEHDASIWEKIRQSVGDSGLASLAHLIQLLRFIQA